MGVLLVARARVDRSLLRGTLYPDPNAFALVHAADGLPGAPGAGSFAHRFSLPLTPSLRGISLFAQALYLDPGAPRRVSFTAGLQFTLY